MSYSVNPSIVTNGLVLHHDAASSRSYDGRENLVAYSNYNAAAWSVSNGSLTTGIDAPDGSNTAVRMSASNSGSTILRVSHPSVSINGTTPYTVSFWVRWAANNSTSSGQLTTDWTDGGPAGDYRPSLQLQQWVRVSYTSTPAAATKTFVDLLSDVTTNYVLDFWGLQVEKGSFATTLTPTNGSIVQRGTSILSLSGTNTGTMNGNVAFSSVGGGAFRLSGNSSAQGYIQVPAGHANYTTGITIQVAASMDLSANWHRFVDFGNGAGVNNIILYRYSGANQIGFDIYGAASVGTVYSTSGSLVSGENAIWCVTADGTEMRVYKNGVLNNYNNVANQLPTNVTRNNCYIGRSNWGWPSDADTTGNFYDVKIYNRALSATEVAKNAAALRGRLGI